MIRNGLYFHNVAELAGSGVVPGGLQPFRFTEPARRALGERGRMMAEEATGCEIRFVTAAANVRVTLLAEGDGEVAVYKGGLQHSLHRVSAGVLHTLHLEHPERFDSFAPASLRVAGFAPDVWRIVFGRHPATLLRVHAFGHDIRAPRPDEMPTLRWLAYGSSITHGHGVYPHSYIDHAARRLQADVCNKGLSGSCWVEEEAIDDLTTYGDWDFATLELGVNMRGRFEPEAFRSRASYALDRFEERHPGKPVFVLTIFPNFASRDDSPAGECERRYNDILREEVARRSAETLTLVEGADIAEGFEDLACDLIHPGAFGNVRMGERLAERIRRSLERREMI
jgi:hypothetical protein